MLGVAIIGAGTIGSVHSTSLLHMSGVQVRAVCDIQFERAQSLANKHGATAFTDMTELAATSVWQDIDVVLVCIPTYLHAETVEFAASHGKHIFCEKPIALSVQSAERMIQVTQEHHVSLGVGHVVRFFPEYVALQHKVRSGALGQLGTVRTFRGGTYPHAWDDWYGDDSRSGGILVDLLIHDLDFVDSQIAPIESLFTRRIASNQRVQRDYALVIGRLKGGALFHMEATWAHKSGFRYGFEYAGSAGLVQFDSSKAAPLTLTTGGQQVRSGGVAVPESPLSKSPYQLELEAYIAAVQAGQPAPVTGQDALRALRLSLAAVQSANEQRSVHI